MSFRQTILDNGLTIVAEVEPEAISSAVGFFVRTGARDEPAELAGVSHFLEHMAFKGNERRTGDDINRLFDEIGAKYNAYTSEESTVYHAAVLPEYVPHAIDLLGDLLRPALRLEDFDMEKKVILEEIGMYSDSPMWTAYERVMRLHFANHPLGNSVLGTNASVGALTADQMRGYHLRRYCPSNFFLAATGKIDWDTLVAQMQEKFGAWQAPAVEKRLQPNRQLSGSELITETKFVQESVFAMAPAPDARHRGRFAAEVLATIIGDDTSSRFHWELAEPGRVDTIDFNYHEYEGEGSYLISLSCRPDWTADNLDCVRRIFDDLNRNGPKADEFESARIKLAARQVIAGEKPRNRLSSLGGNWYYRQEYRSVADDLDDINNVTLGDIRALLEEFPLKLGVTVALGPLDALPNLNG